MNLTLIVCVTLISGIFLFCAGTCAWQAVKLLRLDLLSCRGRILSSGLADGEEIVKNGKPLMMFRPAVTYKYEANMRSLQGDRISIVDMKDTDRLRVMEQASRYQPGDFVTVYFEKDHPEKSYLMHPRKLVGGLFSLSVLLLLIGLGLVWFFWFFLS